MLGKRYGDRIPQPGHVLWTFSPDCPTPARPFRHREEERAQTGEPGQAQPDERKNSHRSVTWSCRPAADWFPLASELLDGNFDDVGTCLRCLLRFLPSGGFLALPPRCRDIRIVRFDDDVRHDAPWPDCGRHSDRRVVLVVDTPCVPRSFHVRALPNTAGEEE